MAVLASNARYRALRPIRLARPPCLPAPAPLVGATAHLGTCIRYAVIPDRALRIILPRQLREMKHNEADRQSVHPKPVARLSYSRKLVTVHSCTKTMRG